MKEHTNKLAFNYQTLQEAAKQSAVAEQGNGGRVECELFQGWASATSKDGHQPHGAILKFVPTNNKGRVGEGQGILFVLICRQIKSIFTTQCQSCTPRNLSTRTNFISWNLLAKA